MEGCYLRCYLVAKQLTKQLTLATVLTPAASPARAAMITWTRIDGDFKPMLTAEQRPDDTSAPEFTEGRKVSGVNSLYNNHTRT